MYDDYFYREQYPKVEVFSSTDRMLREKKKQQQKKKQQRRKNPYEANVQQRRKNYTSYKKDFKTLDGHGNKILKNCNILFQGIETILKLTMLAGIALLGISKYLDAKESRFSSEYTPEGVGYSGASTGHMSKEGKEKLKNHEGLKLEAYDLEGKGVYTIGYGHYGTIDGKPITKGMKITKEKAEELFEKDVAAKEELVKSQLKKAGITTPISQKQFDAMVNYAFMHKLGPKFLAKLKAGDYIGASKELDFDKGMKNEDRMKYLQESFRADVTSDNKLKSDVNAVGGTVKTTSAGKVRQFKNGTMVGGYKMTNPNSARNYIELSERAEAYLKDVGGSGIVTSGAEGSHALGALSHSSGNKIDVQGNRGANTTDIEYAQLCIPFLKNKNTAYVNLESFSQKSIDKIVEYIRTHDSTAYQIAISSTPYSPGRCFWGQGKMLCAVKTKYPRHLDIGIKPDAYSKKQAKTEAKQKEEETKNTKKVEENNKAIEEQKKKEREQQKAQQPKQTTKSGTTVVNSVAPDKNNSKNYKDSGTMSPKERIKAENESYVNARKYF